MLTKQLGGMRLTAGMGQATMYASSHCMSVGLSSLK